MSVGAVSKAEAARLFMVSERTIEREIADGKLTTIKIRGRVRIPMDSIHRWQRMLENSNRSEPAEANPYFCTPSKRSSQAEPHPVAYVSTTYVNSAKHPNTSISPENDTITRSKIHRKIHGWAVRQSIGYQEIIAHGRLRKAHN